MSTWIWVIVVAAYRRRRCTDLCSATIQKTPIGADPLAASAPNTTAPSKAPATARLPRPICASASTRHDELELRPLAPARPTGYMNAWQGTQAEFVDNPVRRRSTTPTASSRT